MEFGTAELCILVALLIVLVGPARLVGLAKVVRGLWRSRRERNRTTRIIE